MYSYQNLKKLREEKKLKQEDIAAVLEIARQQYQLYESGKREIPLHLAIKLSDFYGASMDYIAGKSDDKLGFSDSNLTSDEKNILRKYRSLDEKSQGKLIERLDMLCGDK